MESGVLQPPLALQELRARVVDANRALVRAELVTLTFGNASAADRDSGVMAIKPSGVAFDALCVDDIPILDIATGEVVAGAGPAVVRPRTGAYSTITRRRRSGRR